MSVQPEMVNETPVVSLDGLDDDELEQIDLLEANAATSTPSLAPDVIRAQKYYFPGCFSKASDRPPKPISPDKILAYDSQEEENWWEKLKFCQLRHQSDNFYKWTYSLTKVHFVC